MNISFAASYHLSGANYTKKNQPGGLNDLYRMRIVLTLLELQRSNSKKLNPVNDWKPKPCSFTKLKIGLEEGICTYFGACRFQGEDYMFQGGCVENNMRGNLPKITPIVCSMMVTRRRVVKGMCTKSGHCWGDHQLQLLHSECED